MYFYALSIVKDRHTAEDVVQDVYVKVYRNIKSYKPGTNGLMWMIKITKNTAIDAKNDRPLIVITEKAGKGKSPEFAVTGAAFVDYILASLKKNERRVVVMRLYGGCTFGEVASSLGITENAAEIRYRSAMKKLKVKLEKEGIFER
jgi:RNA polymerase sigma-70 factor (ECF subfamily)